MIPSWSDKHPSKHARKIYNGAWISALVVGGLANLILFILVSSLARRLGWPDGLGSGGVGGGVVIVMALAHTRGVRALKRAGLVREASEIIERTATTFAGEPLEVRDSSVAARMGFVAFLLLLVAGCYWLFQSSPFNPLYHWGGLAGALIFGVVALLILVHADKPELRMDERAILSCQGWTSARFVRWENIARLERKRVWGLPPNYKPTETATETIALQDENGKPLLFLSAGNAAGGDILAVLTDNSDSRASKSAKPSQTQLFVAEIERRLTAATPPQGEENLDG